MSFVEAVWIALSSLRANRLRSLLTLLGIVVGVMAVIAVVSIISGLNDYVAGKIFNLGPDVITVTRMSPVITSLDEFIESQKRKNLYLSDMAAIAVACADCRAVGASVNARSRVKFGRDYLDSEIRGLTAETPAIRGYELQAGRFLTEYVVEHARNVVVIGTDIVDNLFPFVDPIGRTLIVDDRPFEVIGVSTKQGSVLGQSQDNWVMIPITLHRKMYGARRSVNIYAKAFDAAHLAAAESEIRLTLRARRHLSYDAKDDFALNTNDNFLQIWANISRAFFALTIAVASISLIVGGIVVMNIMLVSVTERTREIGLRKAVGARRIDILRQFLIESSTIAMIGGALGVLLGVMVAGLVSLLTPLPSAVRLWSVLSGLAVALSVGLFFGTYPASKAAKLDPVEALRSE